MATKSLHDSIALLIDADNAPATKIDFIISELATYGIVNIRKAYGNWTKRPLDGWVKVLHEYAITPKQCFDLVKGKNATDMALLIDAMDILYTKQVSTFGLVSSDCDFTPLVLRIREDGKQVIGFGRQNSPEPFVLACSHFIYLDEEDTSKTPQNKKENSVSSLKQNTKLMNTLRTAVKEASDEDGWASLAPVGSHISNQGPFNHRTYGFRKLSDLFEAIDLFEVKKTKHAGRSSIRVRLRR
ncbi:NYN domain-containing protein [Aporhodopirellula aestuarii]|uniref:NYN domain-containing protein n=1 Tax=Aporhodopirellula aestuarii TaxID=2950107 RepID=A0ABT0UCH3_9BACT|nr:NYN domain-containing protein [Aporhodopirellula aestuarii]MCM2374728.1 NYN domain-containing protein [Aporhodopirellula aestuarii]